MQRCPKLDGFAKSRNFGVLKLKDMTRNGGEELQNSSTVRTESAVAKPTSGVQRPIRVLARQDLRGN